MGVCDEDLDLQSWGWTDLSSYFSSSSSSSSVWDSEQDHQVLLRCSSSAWDSEQVHQVLLRPSSSAWDSEHQVLLRSSSSVWYSEHQVLLRSSSSVWDSEQDHQVLLRASSSVRDSEQEHQVLPPVIMSRHSLRLDDGLLDRSLPHSSASFSVGGASWRSSRSLKSRRSQQLSLSCSESLLLNSPPKVSGASLLNSSAASDASLLSSLLDESSVQESTLVDTLWGLDEDIDPRESTIVADQSTILTDRTLIGSDGRCPKHLVQTHRRVPCKDCDLDLDRKQSIPTYCSSSKYASSSGPRELETSTIYYRDRSRRTGVLASWWSRSAGVLVYLLTLLSDHMMMLQKHHRATDVLQLLDASLLCVSRAASRCVYVLTLTWQVCRGLVAAGNAHGAGSGLCGVMNPRESTRNQEEVQPDGSLCDDCEEKRHSETLAASSSSYSFSSSSLSSSSSRSSSSSSSRSSVASCLWNAAVLTGPKISPLVVAWLKQATRPDQQGSWSWFTSWSEEEICVSLPADSQSRSTFDPQNPFSRSECRTLRRSTQRKTAADVYGWLNGRWRHMTSGFLPTRFPHRLLLVLVLVLVPLLLFTGLQSGLPEVHITEWRTVVSSVPGLSSIYSFMSSQSQPAEGAVEQSREAEPLYSRRRVAGKEEEEEPVADESMRLVGLEQSLAALWEHVEVGGQRAEQRHMEVLRLYANLQQQLVSEPWTRGQLDQFRRQLDEDRRQKDQSLQQDLLQHRSQTSRLDQLELQLQTLAATTEELQWRQEAVTAVSPSPGAAVSGGVDSHDALLVEVARLEEALEDVRREVEGLSGCRDGCRRLDELQQTVSTQVSTQVREEVRVLVYGNQLTVVGGAPGDGLPDSLLQWLSQQLVSGADLEAALASLELSILQNVSQQLERRRKAGGQKAGGKEADEEAGEEAVVTREDVNIIVKNALRLFSQDRTGLADYALESGGGSVLSTRCSETYETKAALLSLFGLPLWYFSQSPRAVIQPDVHPGNCWAFRGSRGFLVIRLSMRILPTAFTLEHIPRILTPSGTLHSAPRDFSVYGLEDEGQERGTLLGSYTYDEDGEALQTYLVTEENDGAFQIIEVQVLSNWGHEEYTCIYRFRVHGTPSDARGLPEDAGGLPEEAPKDSGGP